jgi:hypothetical protein
MGARLTHWALPLAASALPTRAGFALIARAARSDRVRHACEQAAFANAARFVDALPWPDRPPSIERDAWMREWRLVQFVDNADLFVSIAHRRRWLDAVHVHGDWPRRGAFLALSAHWGAGLCALVHLRRAGHRARFLLLRIDREALAADRAYRAYVDARVRAVERTTGAPVIYTGGAAAEIDAAWKSGVSVIALCDAPPAAGRSTIVADAGGLSFTMPAGLMRLACERQVPVVSFSAAVDRASGARRVDIEPPRAFADPQAMADALAARLAALIAADPPAWHMWPYADQLIARAARPVASVAT